MSGIEVAGAILAITQILNSSSKLVKGLSNLDDPRVDLLQAKLMTQRSFIKSWGNRFRDERANGRLNVPDESVEDVKHILERMTVFWKRAEEKMAKIYRAADGRMTARVLMHRFLFTNGGFEELKDLTDAVDAMNEALKFIALPPPYHDPTGFPPQMHGYDTENSGTDRVRPAPAEVFEGDVTPWPESRASEVPLKDLYNSCNAALALLAREVSELPILEVLHSRISQWGNTLFQGFNSLDTIMKEDGPEEVMYAAVIRALVYIAVIEESLLRLICAESQERHSRLKSHRIAMTAILGSELLSELALEIWADFQQVSSASSQFMHAQAFVNFRGNALQSGQDLHAEIALIDYGDFDNATIESLTTKKSLKKTIQSHEGDATPVEVQLSDQAQHSTTDEADEAGTNIIDYLSKIIDMLFDLTPAIRALRRAHLLKLEEIDLGNSGQAPTSAVAEKQATRQGEDVSEEQITKHIENGLGLALSLENVLENDEAWAKEIGQKITLYAPIVRKERERLEEFERSNVRPKDSDTKKEILDTVSGLEKALRQTLEDVEVKEKPEGKLGGKSYMDVKFSGRETDQKLSELLNVFRDSNAALWSH